MPVSGLYRPMDQRRPVICLLFRRLPCTSSEKLLVDGATLMMMFTVPYGTLIHDFTCFHGRKKRPANKTI